MIDVSQFFYSPTSLVGRECARGRPFGIKYGKMCSSILGDKVCVEDCVEIIDGRIPIILRAAITPEPGTPVIILITHDTNPTEQLPNMIIAKGWIYFTREASIKNKGKIAAAIPSKNANVPSKNFSIDSEQDGVFVMIVYPFSKKK